MKREDLKEFNLSDEQVQKIMDLHGACLLYTSEGTEKSS